MWVPPCHHVANRESVEDLCLDGDRGDRKAAGDRLSEGGDIGVTPKNCCAPPGPRPNPVIVSSKISRVPVSLLLIARQRDNHPRGLASTDQRMPGGLKTFGAAIADLRKAGQTILRLDVRCDRRLPTSPPSWRP